MCGRYSRQCLGVMQKEGEGCIEATFYLIPGNYCRREKATVRNYEVDAVIPLPNLTLLYSAGEEEITF